ncbi:MULTISPECIES: MarC family protein [Helicobacter]|uniref:UPF0056 membrane protein n=1 Tax=Helicobacter ibis TaxID=2962633 RepID=A0ABT4VE49_9HELI|nr:MULTISPECIES: MarC family protein [Helicobacter]MDA3966406.1 MarC family protein [Helicobacter sp. WB40]MDA3968979.1 MarC family protein [Helicobacter ibis]
MFDTIESQLYAILVASVTILSVMNPFGNLPQFISMTEELESQVKQYLFRNILFTSFIIVIIFIFIGPFIMKYLFKVDLNDLRIAGGLLLILVSLKSLLFTQRHNSKAQTNLTKSELLSQSIVPMAFPMLVGPGTLSTIIILIEVSGLMTTLYAVIASFLFMFILFHFAATIERVLGKLVLHVLSRIALIFIMAIGVKMIIIGIQSIIEV